MFAQGVIQQLRGPSFTQFWPPSLEWTIVAILHDTSVLCTDPLPPPSSGSRSYWMTPKHNGRWWTCFFSILNLRPAWEWPELALHNQKDQVFTKKSATIRTSSLVLWIRETISIWIWSHKYEYLPLCPKVSISGSAQHQKVSRLTRESQV